VESPTFGRYVLGPRIAQGGMGEVYLATQTGMGAFAKPLVLKLMLPHLARRPKAIEMFLAEARLASRMNHPNVVQLFDVGVIDDRYFIAMELVRGVSLSRLLSGLASTGEALSEELVIYIARCLCDALHHAHEQLGADGKPLDLVHQDVTLENVLVGTEGQVKLTDFGIARVAEGPGEGTVRGKQGYIAPELRAGASADRRVDVYSAAVTLFSLAALERPDQRGGAPVPAVTKTTLSPELRAALERASDDVPARRFDSARRFRDALPPLTAPDAAEQLGALVQRICAAQVTQLDGDVQRTAAVFRTHGATDAVINTSPPTQRRREPLFIALGALTLVVAVMGVAIVRRATTDQSGTTGVAVINAGPGAQPSGAQPSGAQPSGAQPSGTQSSGTQSNGTQPNATQVAALQPNGTPPSGTQPNGTQPNGTQPSGTQPSGTQLGAPTGTAQNDATGKRNKKGKSKPTAPVSEPAGTATLTIDATPWAMVSIDGKAIGETPIGRYAVHTGTVVIDFVNPETGAKGRRTVVLKPGQSLAINETLR
jgi:serine/threonine-protein kinase